MKAEHRKELQTNVLADKLGHLIEGIKQGPSRSTIIWVVIALLIVLAYLAFRYFSTSSEERASERWLKLDQAVFPEQLDILAEDKDLQGSTPGHMVQLLRARRLVKLGLRDLGGSARRPEAQASIRKGVEAYEQLLNEGRSLLPVIRQEALWGAAQGEESLGKLDKARGYYEKLVQEFGTSARGEDAKKQLKRLDSDASKETLPNLVREYGEK
jgi:hypothetical protein